MKFKFALGEIVEDIVSGFRGVVCARVEYLNGCRQYGVRPQVLHEGKRIDSDYIDEGQLRGVGDSITIEPAATITGGPMDHPPSTSGI